MERHILTDCDGCLLQWNYAFDLFMHENGFACDGKFDSYHLAKRYGISTEDAYEWAHRFNTSPMIRNLPAYADAAKYIPKLVEEGFRFTAISSLSNLDIARQHRSHNLRKLFGEVFDDVICLDTGVRKAEVLKRWEGSGLFWIEDHNINALDGANLGLKSIIIDQPYNRQAHEDDWKLHSRTSHTQPWKDIYNAVVMEYADVCLA